MTIRVFEAFAGVGSQRMALRNLGIDHEVVAIAEIDKFAIKSYEAIHGKTNNLGDISRIKTADIPDHDLFTYSFPCQDISVAGKGLGLNEGSDTRSGLLWECQKVIYGKRPKYLLLENVKNLVGKKHKHNFDKWLEWLEKQGYTNYWEVLNAKDYGVPQNRERVFVVSILGRHEPYEFPEPIELELRLKNILESEVDEKFYLSDERVGKLTFRGFESKTNVIATGDSSSYEQNNRVYDIEKESPTITARDYKDPKRILEPQINQVAQYDTPTRKNSNRFRTYGPDGIAPTINTMGGGGLEPHIIATSRGRNKESPSDRTIGSPSIITHNYTEQVKVRKHEVDIDGLRDLLKSHKQSSGKTNREISELLDEPMTLVEHWFRNDNSFAIPKEDKWLQLKEILSISTDSFDEQIMEFEIRDGVFDQANRAYDGDGMSPTLTATDGDKKILVDNSNIKPINPLKDKTTNGWHFEQQVYDSDGITRTVKAGGGSGNIPKTIEDLRIRKLTPKECWRLMGFSDEDFHKAEEVNSNSQLYRQADNSIVVDVLEGIFKQLLGE